MFLCSQTPIEIHAEPFATFGLQLRQASTEAVSLLTLTAIRVDRLLVLMSGLRYKHVVTLGRVWVFVVILCLSTDAIVVTIIHNVSVIVFTIISLCVITFFLLYKNLSGATTSSSPITRLC